MVKGGKRPSVMGHRYARPETEVRACVDGRAGSYLVKALTHTMSRQSKAPIGELVQ